MAVHMDPECRSGPERYFKTSLSKKTFFFGAIKKKNVSAPFSMVLMSFSIVSAQFSIVSTGFSIVPTSFSIIAVFDRFGCKTTKTQTNICTKLTFLTQARMVRSTRMDGSKIMSELNFEWQQQNFIHCTDDSLYLNGFKNFVEKISDFYRSGLGASAGGAKPSQTALLNGRP